MNDDLYRAMLNDGIIREDVISKMVERIAFLSQRLADAEAALAAHRARMETNHDR